MTGGGIRIIATGMLLPVLMLAAGCGTRPRPRPEVPVGVTADEALAVLRGRADTIRDFRGRAGIAVDIDGSRESAGLAIRYLKPDEIRVVVSVTFGITIAVITAIDDSVTVYDTRENVYFRVDRGRAPAILHAMIPDARIDPGLLPALFSPLLPPPGEMGRYRPSITRAGRNAMLILTDEPGETTYRYLLEGPDLRIVEEAVTVRGEMIWSKRVSDYGSDNGVVFPDKMTVTNYGREMEIEFSRYSINTGLNAGDLIFDIPSSAERLPIEPK